MSVVFVMFYSRNGAFLGTILFSVITMIEKWGFDPRQIPSYTVILEFLTALAWPSSALDLEVHGLAM